MVFPQVLIDETKRQTGRDLTRFDLDFDLPQHLLPEFPAPIYLTTRPDLGDVSKGQLVTLANFYELFKDVAQPEAARRPAAPRHAVSPGAVQRHRGPSRPHRPPGRRVLRLPRQRAHERGHAHRRRHPSERASPPHRHADAPRREHPAPVRLAARDEERGGLHGVRAARRVLRRRPRPGPAQGRQHPRARQPGALHGRDPGPPRLPARAEAQRPRQARPRRRRPRASCAARRCSSARPSAAPVTPRRTTPTTSCTTCARSASTPR